MPSDRVETLDDLISAIRNLPHVQPTTDEFSRLWSHEKRHTPWYVVETDYEPQACPQQRHWLGYLESRRDKLEEEGRPFPDARVFYARVHNPQMLIYLAEAAGVSRALIQKAMIAALAAVDSMPAMAKAIRGFIPWDVVEPALQNHVRGPNRRRPVHQARTVPLARHTPAANR